MISDFSNHIALFLGKNLDAEQDKIEVYAYGLEILLGAAIKLVSILALAWVLDALNTTFILLCTYAALRWFGGGAHMSTYLKCLILGTTLIVGLGKISQSNLEMQLLTNLSMFTLAFAVCICLKWVPGDTKKKPINDRKIRNKQKGKMAVIIAIWGLAVSYLVQNDANTCVLAMNLGCISSVFFITPWGYQLLTVIDKLTR